MNGNAPLPDFLSESEVALLKKTMLKQFGEDEQESFIRICPNSPGSFTKTDLRHPQVSKGARRWGQ
jgi:hypothetical protein